MALTGQHAHHRPFCLTPLLWVHAIGTISAVRGPSVSIAVHHIFLPAMSVSKAPEGKHAYQRHPSSYDAVSTALGSPVRVQMKELMVVFVVTP